MTRINTNISSLIAQTNLGRANNQLQQALTRLSTGLRINTGADDPAGLIASENLRSDISGVQKGISNSQRANQIIATADSALGQVSSLLNDLRGLVAEAANTGAMSDAQIQANQLQVDSSLASIDRIAQTTSFQGRKLLDGSLDFITSGIIDGKASKTVGSVVDAKASLAGVSGVNFTALAVGAGGNSITVAITTGAATATGVASVAGNAITVQIKTAVSTAADILTGLQANLSATALVAATATTPGTTATAAAAATLAGGADGNEFIVTANAGGLAWNGSLVNITAGSTGTTPTTSFDASTNTLTVIATSTSTANELITAINNDGHFTGTLLNSNGSGSSVAAGATTLAGATLTPSKLSNLRINQANFGTASSIGVQINIDQQATQASLTYAGGKLLAPIVLEIGGDKGFNTFNFGAGTDVYSIRDAVNQLSDATGVQALVTNGNLALKSVDYGSAGFVSTKALSGTFTTTDTNSASLTSVTRAVGSDIALRVNGLKATGSGLNATLNSSTLSLSFAADASLVAGEVVTFSIDGGGAKFQLGPDVVSSQQARFGIQSISTAQLGGLNGKLYELSSGNGKALANDPRGASAVVADVINAVTTLRGRLGAFQKTTLDTNIATLTDTLTNLTDAQSTIRDADFAAESANLTRGQILVQAGTQVLQISNQRPQAILALLRGQ